MSRLKNSETWLKELYPTYTVLDPDGWDRSNRENYDKSWNEKITKDEFERRFSASTVGERRELPRRYGKQYESIMTAIKMLYSGKDVVYLNPTWVLMSKRMYDGFTRGRSKMPSFTYIQDESFTYIQDEKIDDKSLAERLSMK